MSDRTKVDPRTPAEARPQVVIDDEGSVLFSTPGVEVIQLEDLFFDGETLLGDIFQQALAIADPDTRAQRLEDILAELEDQLADDSDDLTDDQVDPVRQALAEAQKEGTVTYE